MRPVSELAELLELLHGADAPFETLYGRFRTWHHHERAQAAFRAYHENRGGTSVGVATARTVGPVEEESERTVSIWRQQPDRARMERSDGYGVRVGKHWWMWQEGLGALSNVDDSSAGSAVGEEFGSLLRPGHLLGALRFEPIGPGERAGRDVIVADAWLRTPLRSGPDGFALHELGLGADRYRLEVDAERGLVLASQAFTDDVPFTEVSALELTLDEPLDPALFEFLPPEGEEVRSPRALHHVRHNVSITEAQAAMPFTVMIPERVPSSWHVRCSYVGESERTGPSVHLHYHSDSAHESLNINQGYESHIPREEFEEAREGERKVWVRGREKRFPQAQLYTEHEDTKILMTSDTLTIEQLIGLAAMLVPAPAASEL
jgi:hypothetical protein